MINQEAIDKHIKERTEEAEESWQEFWKESKICRNEGEEDWDSIIKYGKEA